MGVRNAMNTFGNPPTIVTLVPNDHTLLVYNTLLKKTGIRNAMNTFGNPPTIVTLASDLSSTQHALWQTHGIATIIPPWLCNPTWRGDGDPLHTRSIPSG
jgi:hypothetical protein